MPDEGLPRRTLRTAFWVAALFVVVFAARNEPKVSLGIALGAALGLFSLWSFVIVVPRLTQEGGGGGKLSLGLLLALKLPLYGVVIGVAMASPWFSPLAVAAGVALVPAVLALKVIGYRFVQPADG